MIDSPLITCVIPTYRRPQMVARAIRSALQQTFASLRVFVSDNASSDETAEVVRAIQAKDPRVIYHCQPKNLGMNANIAYGFSRVETPFFSLLSDDDILLPEFYESAYLEFEKYPQAILVATQVPFVSDSGRVRGEPLSSWDRFGLFEPPTGAYRVAGIGHPTITGILFRREFLQTPYAYPNPRIHASDYEMIFNAAYNFPIATVNKPGALFIQHRGQSTGPSDPFSIVDHGLACISRVENDSNFPQDIKNACRLKWQATLSTFLRTLIVRSVLNNQLVYVEKALTILAEQVCNPGMASTLSLLHRICLAVPVVRYSLRQLHPTIIKIRDLCFPLLDANSRILLK